ncbi:MAG: glucose 1-dehydrogenase [Proteobacteria bacterium]|nr:glucose 1-dehydrogenase [Pseudomonadota bacterium]
MQDMKGQTAIVTGGGRGIGRAICLALAARGAAVAIADIRGEDAEATARAIQEPGGRAMFKVTDITDLASVKAMVDRTREILGPVDILVNNAGWDRMTPFAKTTPEFWDTIIAINFKGVLHMVHATMGDMIEKNRGKIVNISSDAARVGSMGEAVYAGAKAAVIGFSKSLARELARNNINVNVVCPGPTETPLVEEMKKDGAFAEKVLSGMDRIIPLRRMGRPDDIASAVAFLASPEADFITGQILSVSGGLTMC